VPCRDNEAILAISDDIGTNVWYNHNVDLQRRLHKEQIMKPNTKIEISVFGALLISAAIAALAVATSRLVDSFVSEGEPGSGDWSVDEREYGKY